MKCSSRCRMAIQTTKDTRTVLLEPTDIWFHIIIKLMPAMSTSLPVSRSICHSPYFHESHIRAMYYKAERCPRNRSLCWWEITTACIVSSNRSLLFYVIVPWQIYVTWCMYVLAQNEVCHYLHKRYASSYIFVCCSRTSNKSSEAG